MAGRGGPDIEETWRTVEPTLAAAMNPEKGVTHDSAMYANAAVHNYCTGTGASRSKAPEATRIGSPSTGADARPALRAWGGT